MNVIGRLFASECQYGCISQRIALKPSTKLVRRCISNINTRSVKNISRKWQLVVPAGVGLSLVAVTQWKYLQNHGYPINTKDKSELLNDVMVTCYCCLPLRITSRIWGWLTSINLPVSLRPTLYEFYANMFHANLDEIELDLSAFPSLVDFFVRALKHSARPIAQSTNMISPADGKVLYFGPVTTCCVEQVKGATYNLKYFLGDLSNSTLDQIEQDDYVNLLLKNSNNRLYQLIIYLAPGDYHRFHSPTDWNIKFRRHFSGKLLSVNPRILRHMPNLFSLNERVVYIGEWADGFMAYAAVGATNVGSIKIYCDKELATNTAQWLKSDYQRDVNLDNINVDKGELFGEFRLGSTIVLLFEAPQDFQFCLQIGQTIKVGNALSACFKKKTTKEHTQQEHLIMNIAHDWRNIWKPEA